MGTPSAEGAHELQAFTDVISRSLVYVVIDFDGYLSNGTAVLVKYNDRVYIASALHVFGDDPQDVSKYWAAARFRFRDAGPIKHHESRSFPISELLVDAGISIPLTKSPLVSVKHDLIAAELPESFVVPPAAVPFDLAGHVNRRDLEPGMSLIMAGTPFNGAVRTPDGSQVLHPFLEHVRYDPGIDTSRLPSSYRRDDHLLFSFSLANDAIEPQGFSGAPVWVQDATRSEIWAAYPVLAGIAVSYHRRHNLIQTVKGTHLLTLLDSGTLGESA